MENIFGETHRLSGYGLICLIIGFFAQVVAVYYILMVGVVTIGSLITRLII